MMRRQLYSIISTKPVWLCRTRPSASVHHNPDKPVRNESAFRAGFDRSVRTVATPRWQSGTFP